MEFPAEALKMITFPMMAGIITWLVTQVLGIIFMIKFKPDKKNPKIDEAIRRGHVVKGVNNGKWDGHNDRLRDVKDTSYKAEYVYEVNGKKMIYKYTGHTLPPSTINLYYLDNPSKVFPGMEMTSWARDMAGLRFALVYILPLIFGALVEFRNGTSTVSES